MIEPCCAVCGESKAVNLLMFNYGMCLCHHCTEIAAQSFIHYTAERKLKESEKKRKAVDVEGLPKAEYESMRELKDKLRKEIEADVEAKVRANIEDKRKASRTAEAAIKFANGTHESLMCTCPGCGKQVPRNDMKRFSRGYYYSIYPARFCPDCHEKKNRAFDLQQTKRKLEKTVQAFDNLKAEYESFRERTGKVWWGVTIAGIALGTLLTLMFLNPR